MKPPFVPPCLRGCTVPESLVSAFPTPDRKAPMRVLPPVYFLGSLVVMAVLHMEVPIVHWLPMPWSLVGVVPLGAGIVMAAAANRLFHTLGTPVHPFAQSSILVTQGPFKISRNPMYLGLALVLIGIALLLGTLSPWFLIPPFVAVIRLRFIRHEERALEEQFGAPYDAYRKKVRRWI